MKIISQGSFVARDYLPADTQQTPLRNCNLSNKAASY